MNGEPLHEFINKAEKKMLVFFMEYACGDNFEEKTKLFMNGLPIEMVNISQK